MGYVQIETGKIPPLANAPGYAAALLQIDGENIPFRAPLMEGGQKALLPETISHRILETLNEDTAVTLLLEGHASTFTPDNFSSSYAKFTK